MDRTSPSKLVPGIYSTSLMNVDRHDSTTVYHPLKKSVSPTQLTVELPTAYNYRSRANSNIIERRFSNVEAPVQIIEQLCK